MHPDKRISIIARADLSATSHLSLNGGFWHATVQRIMDSLLCPNPFWFDFGETHMVHLFYLL